MAVAYGSVSTTNFTGVASSPKSITFTKPTGLAEGDYMVAVIGYIGDNPMMIDVSGWTSLGDAGITNKEAVVAYAKTATSADAAASDFTLTVSSGDGVSGDYIGGALIRFTGDAPITTANETSAQTDISLEGGSTAQFDTGVTPPLSSILIMGAVCQTDTTTSADTYAITTSDPTWTERFEDAQVAGTDWTMGIATGPRTATTDTGAYSVTFGNTGQDAAGIIIAVYEQTNATITPTPLTVTSTLPAPVVSADANVSVGVNSITSSVPTVTIDTTTNDWDYDDLPTPSIWTNEDI